MPDLAFTFHVKKGPLPALIKKVLCVTREQLTFSDSDDDFEHSCSIVILARKSQFSSLVAQCTISFHSKIKFLKIMNKFRIQKMA